MLAVDEIELRVGGGKGGVCPSHSCDGYAADGTCLFQRPIDHNSVLVPLSIVYSNTNMNV